MARTDHTGDLIDQTIGIGLRNKELLPSVRNWCGHLDVKDISGGIVAQMRQVPIRLRLSCKHAAGAIEAMQLESIAEQFIVDNCLQCSHHQPKAVHNFGVKVLKAIEERKRVAEEKKKSEEGVRKALTDRIQELINQTKKTAHQPALSILRLIEQLAEGPSPAKTASELLEASQLQPSFFLPEALDAMALHFENPEWGDKVMLATAGVIGTGGKIGSISLERCLELLRQRVHVEQVAAIALQFADFSKLPDWEVWIREFIGSLNYLRVFGYADATQAQQREALLARSIVESGDRMMTILPSFLLSPDKLVRINAARLLQQIGKGQAGFCLQILPVLSQAFELPDNRELESADVAIADTVAEIIFDNGATALAQYLESLQSYKTGEAALAAMHVLDLLLENETFLKDHQDLVDDLAEGLPTEITDKSTTFEYRDHAFETLKLVCESGRAPLSLFTTLNGCLLQINEEKKTHKWYQQQLRDNNVATFNPLAGISIWDIEHIEIKLNSYKDKLVGLVADWLQRDPDSTYQVFAETLKGLDENATPEFKTDLLKVARKGLKSPRYIVKYLPFLYTQLFDKALSTRLQALYFLDILIENYPQLVTDTLLGTIDAFAADPEIAVRAQVLTIVGSIAQSSKIELLDKHIHYVEAGFRQNYVHVIQQAVKAARYIYPKMSAPQVEQLALDLANLSMTPADPKHGDLQENALSVLTEIALTHTKYLPTVVDKLIYPLATKPTQESGDKYVDVLKDIKDAHPEYGGYWLKACLEYLSVTMRDRYNPSFDPRDSHYKDLFESPIQLLNRFKPSLLASGLKVSGRDPIDGMQFIILFCYLEYFQHAKTLCESIQKGISATKSNESLLRVVSAILKSIECFSASSKPSDIIAKIHQAKDELQKLRPSPGTATA